MVRELPEKLVLIATVSQANQDMKWEAGSRKSRTHAAAGKRDRWLLIGSYIA
jgi:hypothetical protein